MNTATLDRPSAMGALDEDLVRLPRRRIDKFLIAFGVIAAVVFAVAGGLLTWGANFADDYVHDELSLQRITFADEASLREEGREDLLQYAGEDVTTGAQAEAFASYIGGHLEETGHEAATVAADAGLIEPTDEALTYPQVPDRDAAAKDDEPTDEALTYSQVPDRDAAAKVDELTESGADEAEIAEAQAVADELRSSRDSLFRGETLRGLLLSSYAWWTIGRIAGIAAWVALAGAAVMAVLVVAGLVHPRRTPAH
jgi:hypothetical protein